jgi:hypothetical protein
MGEMMMQKIRRVLGIGAVGVALLIGSALDSSAQSRRDVERERERYERQQEAIARQNARRERERRQRIREGRRSDDPYYNGGGYYNDGDPYYRGSVRGAVNATVLQGYQQGLMAGQNDGAKRKYNRSNVYRNTGSAPNLGDPTSWDYLYRQGYLEGYEDGYYGRRRY